MKGRGGAAERGGEAGRGEDRSPGAGREFRGTTRDGVKREGLSLDFPWSGPPPGPAIAALAGAQDQDSGNLLEESTGLCFVPQS